MSRLSRRLGWTLGLGLLVLGGGAALCGCQTAGFYAQAIKGEYRVITRRQSIAKLRASPATPADLKARLELLDRLRAFARNDLKLPVDGHYLEYADLGRPFAVWNVEAAPEFSMEPKTWWYPLVGSLEYRGYFAPGAATNYAARLAREGYDVSIGGVTAYSTLGWFRDPVLNTFLFDPEPDLAELIFHELGHQRVFAAGDTDFNEAFATTLGQEGARRWLRAKGDRSAYEKYLAELRRTRQFASLIMTTRERLQARYGDERTEDGNVKAAKKKRTILPEQLRGQKQYLINRLQ